MEMPQSAAGTEAGGDRVEVPVGVFLKPPAGMEYVKAGIERDPEAAEQGVTLIRVLRKDVTQPVNL
jgi:hypothetical protein